MRLWSLHPQHLDARGLVALWREGLLARKVLRGETRGYRHHPQLQRFRECSNPIAAIDCYLSRVVDEARERGYEFDASKIQYSEKCSQSLIKVTSGQLEYEWKHLLAKLKVRDSEKWKTEKKRSPEPHDCFQVVPGEIADWEKV